MNPNIEPDPVAEAVAEFTEELQPAFRTFKTSETPAEGDQDEGMGGFEDGEPPPNSFPLDALPSALRGIVEEVAKAALVPVPLAVIPALGILSGAIGAGVEVRSGGDRRTRANLYIMAIAASGTGKGQSASLIAAPFREAERIKAEQWQKEELPLLKAKLEVLDGKHKRAKKAALDETDSLGAEQATQDLAELERERLEIERQLEREPGFSVENITSEKLAVSLASQPGEALLSLSAEARGVAAVLTGRYTRGKTDDSLYLSAFSGDYCRTSRLNRPSVELHSPCLAVTWLIQPDAAAELFENEGLSEGGMLPRFLLADTKAEAEDEPEEPYTMDRGAVEAWGTLIGEALGFRARGNDPIVIEAEAGALAALRNFTNESKRRTRETGDLKDVGAFPKRWGEQAWKIAVCFHVAKEGRHAGERALSQGTAHEAIQAMRWFANEQLAVLHRGRTAKQEKRLLVLCRKLEDAGGGATLADLKKRNGFEPDEVEQLSTLFPARVEIQTRHNEGGGRPSRTAILQRASNP